jgi:hypothetical protein
VTDTAADAAFAETALVFLLFRAVKTGFNAIGLAFFPASPPKRRRLPSHVSFPYPFIAPL